MNGLIPDVHFMPYPYAYRCPFGVGGEQTHELSSRYIENLLDDPESGIVSPAGMIFEVVQGEGGSIPAPVEWLREMRRITQERNIPLIIDEVQTGLGRTGKLFAFEHAASFRMFWYCPKRLAEVCRYPLSFTIANWMYGNRGAYRYVPGNQMAMAAGLATLKFIKEHDVPGKVEKLGQHLRNHLNELKLDVNCIGDVRGRGLMVGVEIVNAKASLDRLGHYPQYPELARRIQQECFHGGLILEVGADILPSCVSYHR